MTYVNFKQYEKEKIDFFKQNGGLEKTETSTMENNVYFKYYYTSNNKVWYERIETYYKIDLKGYDEIHKCNFTKQCECTRIEFWNDKNAETKIYLEIY